MASRGMAGQGCGSQPTGEKCPRGHATRAAPPCLRCAFWQHFHHHPASNARLPTALRVALVDSDPGAHEFVRQTLKAHAEGWMLDSHHSPDSLLAALGFPPIALHSAPPAPSTNCDVLHSHTPHYQLSTPPTINRHLDAPPDVVLMEPHWPGLSGIDCVRRLIARLSKSRFVMFTACADYDTIVESLMAGALGYLVKPVAPGNVVYTISEAAQRRPALSGQAQDALLDFACRAGAARRSGSLSWREREVMLLLLQGASSKEIAQKLGIEEGTVNRHLHDIYHKMGVHRKADALRRFVGRGGGKVIRSERSLTYVQSLYNQHLSTVLASRG
jgi:DNA-binding NarL/FixJ family response regulator